MRVHYDGLWWDGYGWGVLYYTLPHSLNNNTYLRKLIGEVLYSPRHRSKRYNLNDVIFALELGADVDGNADITIDVADYVKRSVADGGLRLYEYALPYSYFLGRDDDGSVLYVKKERSSGVGADQYIITIGCFSSAEAAQGAEVVRWNIGLGLVREEELVADLKKKSRNQSSSTARKSTKNNQRQSSPNGSSKKLRTIVSSTDNVLADAFAALREAEKECYDLRATQQTAHEKYLAAHAAYEKANTANEHLISETESDSNEAARKIIQCRLDTYVAMIKTQEERLLECLSAKAATEEALRKFTKNDVPSNEISDDDNDDGDEDEDGDKDTIKDEYTSDEFTDGHEIVLHAIINGRACDKMTIDSKSILSLRDFTDKLVPLHYTDNEKTTKLRRTKANNFTIREFGAVQTHEPPGSTVFSSNHLTRIKSEAATHKNIMKLLRKERCPFSPESMTMLMGYAQHCHGGSDEGKQMMIAGTLHAFFMNIDFDDYTPKQIAAITPSQTMIAVHDLLLGVDCFVVQCHTINKSGVKTACFSSDHGNRKGMDSLAKLLTHAGFDEEGNEIVVDFLLDFDKAGHKTEEAADAIIASLQRLKLLCPDLKIVGISGDAGGGGAVQYLYTRLVELGLMDKDSRWSNCGIHSINKTVERPVKDTAGDQGLKMNTSTQLCFSATKMLLRLEEEGGEELQRAVRNMVIEKLVSNEEWQEDAARNSTIGLESFLTQIDENAIDFCLRGLEPPIWTRWYTMIKAARIMSENWTIIRFFCIAIIQTKLSKAYLRQLAEDTLKLMNTKAKNSEGKDTGEPQFKCQLEFLVAFDDTFFANAFEVSKRHDPLFPGSFGARLWPERVAYWRKQLMDLSGENGEELSWKYREEFAAFRESIKDMPELGEIGKGGAEYFAHYSECFFNETIASFNKLLGETWRMEKLLVYIIAGNPTLARHFLQWLAYADEGNNPKDYVFDPIQVVELEFHSASNDTVTIGLQECMGYLLDGADAQAMLNDPLIKDNKELLWTMAAGDEVVNMFNRKTWAGEDYTPFSMSYTK